MIYKQERKKSSPNTEEALSHRRYTQHEQTHAKFPNQRLYLLP